MVAKRGIIAVSVKKSEAPLTRAQKQFNKLIKDIELEREKLSKWKELIPLYQQKYMGEFKPLLFDFKSLQADLVRLLDSIYNRTGFTKNERSKIKDIICSLADELMDMNDAHKLKDLYNKYNNADFDQEMALERQNLKNMVAKNFGIDLGNIDDIGSPEEIMAKFVKTMQEQADASFDIKDEKPSRKKSAKTLAKEAKLKGEALEISQSLKALYRKLVSSIHPDLESDADERERKTSIMQKVNEAYNNNDLLRLLELQLELEQLDQSSLNTMSPDRLAVYNKTLREQIVNLREELEAIQMGFRMRFDLPPDAFLQLPRLLPMLQRDIAHITKDIKSLKQELSTLTDTKTIKTWLKNYEIPLNFDLNDMIFY